MTILHGMYRINTIFFIQDHNLKEDNVSNLLDSPYVRSTGYLARAVVNTVLKGGQISKDLESEPESCKIS